MKFSTIFTPLLAIIAAALPSNSSGIGKCISQSEANTFVNTFIGLETKTDPNLAETAKTILTEDVVRMSTSINMLRGRDPEFNDGVNYSDRDSWVANILRTVDASSDVSNLEILASCDKIYWYWKFGHVGGGNDRFPVRGGVLFYMTREGGLLKAKEAVVEFNSLAYALDLGFTCNYPNGTEV